MQWFGSAPVAGADVRTSRNQITGKLDVVRERRGVQRGISFVDLRVTLKNAS
jgi:hypothetical protein